jgi:CRISPR-associated endonuclease Csn1
MSWRLGVDLGTNSIGWWAFRLHTDKNDKRTLSSLDGGVLLFSDGREPSKGGRGGDSLAVERRLARGMRRNRLHGRNRIAALVKDLIALGLLPVDAHKRQRLFRTMAKRDADPERYNPYRMRAEGVTRILAPYELGRALLHLGLRRGYKSNRKEASDEEGGKLKPRIDALRETLGGQTLGQHLWQRFCDGNPANGVNRGGVRFRADEDFYPDRAMLAEEFDAIRACQEPQHALTEADWARLRDERVLFQWPLKPVQRGACEFFADQERHWRDTPIGHSFRIYQELNNLKWVDARQVEHALDAEQRADLLSLLMTRASDVKFAPLRKRKRRDKSPMFPPDSHFNLEDDKRKGLKPHRLAVLLAKDLVLAELWPADDDDSRLDDIFEILHEAVDDDEAVASLVDSFKLNRDVAIRLAAIPLGKTTASVSRKFMAMVVPVLRDQGLVYSDAVAELTDDEGEPLHHSMRDDGRRWYALPYYGEVLAQSMLGADPAADAETFPEKHFGRINNPTVHVALTELCGCW